MILSSQNTVELLNTSDSVEIKTGIKLLIDLGMRSERNGIAFGVITKTISYGSRILRMLDINLNKGVNARLPKMEFQFLECEYLNEPVSVEEMDFHGEVESNYTVFSVYKFHDLDGLVVLKAQNGTFCIIKAL